MNWIDSVSSTLLGKDLDGLWVRQQAISDNMANVETPGYKAKQVSFEDQLLEELASFGSTNPQEASEALSSVTPQVTEAEGETFREDGNGVDLEQQMIDMVRTTTNYSYSLRQMSDYFARLNTAISGTVK
jgi:flagellar basal-body rod protein FlgB